MRNGWLIYDQAQYRLNRWFADRLLASCGAFAAARLVLAERLSFGVENGAVCLRYDGAPVDAPDFAIVRTIYPLLSQMLEQAGVRCFNRAEVSQVCNDKRLSYALAVQAGVPVLPTLFFDKRCFCAETAAQVPYPCVLKSASGHGGKEIFLLENAQALTAALAQIPENGFLLQQLCPTVGRDLRVYVLGGRILGAVLRRADGLKSNYSLGGSAEAYALRARERRLAEAVVARLPAVPDLIGVDFLLDRGALYFNEIEDVVGCRTLYQTSTLDAAQLFSDHIRRCMQAPTGGAQ